MGTTTTTTTPGLCNNEEDPSTCGGDDSVCSDFGDTYKKLCPALCGTCTPSTSTSTSTSTTTSTSTSTVVTPCPADDSACDSFTADDCDSDTFGDLLTGLCPNMCDPLRCG